MMNSGCERQKPCRTLDHEKDAAHSREVRKAVFVGRHLVHQYFEWLSSAINLKSEYAARCRFESEHSIREQCMRPTQPSQFPCGKEVSQPLGCYFDPEAYVIDADHVRDLPWRRACRLDRETSCFQERLGIPP